MSDLINRQEALDELSKRVWHETADAWMAMDTIVKLPQAHWHGEHRYIDAEELKLNLRYGIDENGNDTDYQFVTEYDIDHTPTVYVAEVRHGRWIVKPHKMMGECPCCSACGSFNPIEYRYCPNCGAKMDEVTQNVDL